MDSSINSAGSTYSANSLSSSYTQIKYSKETLIIEASFGSSNAGTSEIDFSDLYKSLSVSGKKIIDKLNELLKKDLPDGIQSLKPEDVTPEATAERIVNGSTAYFDAYAKQHPELEGEELLNSFMETIKGGIDKGYNDASETLEGLGAFDYEGVKEGVEKTKKLIEEKLKVWEQLKRQELRLEVTDPSVLSAENTKSALLSQAGAQTLSVIA